MKYKAVLFDMDGVILDSEPLHEAAFREILQNYGHTLTEDDYKNHFAGKTDEDAFKQYFKIINESVNLPQILSEKANAYIELARNQLQPYTGVVAIIRDIAKKLPLALVTGSLRYEVEVALGSLGIADCFSIIVAAEDVSQGKPNPEGYLKAAKLLNIPIKECIVVEDSPSGIKAAIVAGAYCVAVTNTHTADELKNASKIVDQLHINMF